MEAMLMVLQSLAILAVAILSRVCWLSPLLAYRRLRSCGFGGPTPCFPLGNYREMFSAGADLACRISGESCGGDIRRISHDIHSTVLPYFSKWRAAHGKVFVYWLGTEPFLYVGDPEFLKEATARMPSRCWGKPDVFKRDRRPLFGNGMTMIEDDEWAHHRAIATPAFSPAGLNAMVSTIIDSTNNLIDNWRRSISMGNNEIDVQDSIISNAGEIIARTSFGISARDGQQLCQKLLDVQMILFRNKRLVGVPFSKILSPMHALEAAAAGRELDRSMLSIIRDHETADDTHDLLGLFLAARSKSGRKLSEGDLVAECKTFMFAGNETTALLTCWSLLLLAMYPEWQEMLREEAVEVCGGDTLDPRKLSMLTKMGWVYQETLRLYPPGPNIQRQSREDIRVGDMVIPKGTNLWVDVVAMHHDPELWGKDVNEFNPRRFEDDDMGGCKHRMGFMNFGLGARMCLGRNMAKMEYKIVLSLILQNFSFSVSPKYRHSPAIMLTTRPMYGVPLIIHALEADGKKGGVK